MAISMLRLQMARQGDPSVSEALENAIQRLDHLARIHELLYRQDSNDVQSVDMAAYLTELCRNFGHLQSSDDLRIELMSDADDITLDVDRAINVALIAGEAITNALKHAFPDKRRGAVRVGLHHEGNDVLLSIENNGVGLPANPPRAGSMGMRLIEGMARSLNGTLTIEGDRRTRIAVRFSAASDRRSTCSWSVRPRSRSNPPLVTGRLDPSPRMMGDPMPEAVLPRDADPGGGEPLGRRKHQR